MDLYGNSSIRIFYGISIAFTMGFTIALVIHSVDRSVDHSLIAHLIFRYPLSGLFAKKLMYRSCVFGIGAVRKGSLSGFTIAFTIRSVDHSLSVRLIAPTGVIVENRVMPYTLSERTIQLIIIHFLDYCYEPTFTLLIGRLIPFQNLNVTSNPRRAMNCTTTNPRLL